MIRIFIVLGMILASCGPRTEPFRTAPRPDNPGYGAALPAGHTAFDNASLAALFVKLTHGLESGDQRHALQRFEQPISIGMSGPGSDSYRGFLQDFVAQIARETDAPITMGAPPHNILIRFVPGEEFIPWTSNQCFVLFGQPDWRTYLEDPDAYTAEAAAVQDQQTEIGIFIPDTVEPYKVRECLLEEITQAMGTANDLYGLAPTIFNDDNAHTWPTKLDYLMLRVLYDPRLHSGLSKSESQALAREVLDDINPQGRAAPPLPKIRQAEFSDIRDGLHGLLHKNAKKDRQLATIARLAKNTRSRFPNSLYECTVADIEARISTLSPEKARPDPYEDAISLCSKVVGDDDIRVALLRLEQTAVALDNRQYAKARGLADRLIPVFLAHGLDNKVAEASLIRLVSAFKLDDPKWEDEYLDHAEKWTAYAFGDDNDLTLKLRR